jgi:hypothetical protein
LAARVWREGVEGVERFEKVAVVEVVLHVAVESLLWG